MSNPTIFSQTEPQALLDALLSADIADIVQEWPRTLANDVVLRMLVDVDRMIGQTMTETAYSVLADQSLLLSPLTIFTLVDKARQVRSRQEFEKYAKQVRIPLKEGFKLADIKPYAVNIFDALIKLYICMTYQDAQLYMQMASIMRQHPKSFKPEAIDELTIIHARLAMLVRWYRLSLLVEDSAFLDGVVDETKRVATMTADQTRRLFPPPDIVEETVDEMIDCLDRLKAFPNATLRLMAEEDSLSNLFLIVDAILTVMKTPPPRDDLSIRRRVAQHALVYNIVMENSTWYRNNTSESDLSKIR